MFFNEKPRERWMMDREMKFIRGVLLHDGSKRLKIKYCMLKILRKCIIYNIRILLFYVLTTFTDTSLFNLII